ncbi:serine/threonine-protein kinase mph1-like [Diaphorina citri]|uniref:Serine/threonine-protein kinase mph1-like n=1 Tax=Diaphorina citri TaxID=121845 RepID=A0A3Q0JG36_DIACI|nr:serine/threonine-protein kinase mph1-like [Diaphorina citri]
MNRNVFSNYQRPDQENEQDNTDSGSHPSVFDIQFSNPVRRIGRRNRSTATLKPLENQENPTPSSLFPSNSSESQTHPVNPGAAGLSFLNQLGKSSTNLKTNFQHAQSVEKIVLNNINYRVDQCKKNLNYDPSIKTPCKDASQLSEDILATRKKYPFLVSSTSSLDKENVVPDNEKFKGPTQTKSVFSVRSASDQVDAPQYAIYDQPQYSSAVPLMHEPKPVPLMHEPKPVPLMHEPKPVPLMHEPKPVPLMHEPKPVPLMHEPKPVPLMHEPKPVPLMHEPKPVPLMHEPKPVPLMLEPKPSDPMPTPQPAHQEVYTHTSHPSYPKLQTTPVRPTCEPQSLSQKKNESTPVFKRPLSVNSTKSSDPSVSKETIKPAKPQITTSNAKKSVETSQDVITLNGKQYQVLSLLGKGGSSSVYLVGGTSEHEFKPLALKVVDLSDITDQSIADSYLNEVELLAKLQGCPYVIKMHDYVYDTASKHLYVLMEKGDTDLSKYMRNLNKMTTLPNTMIIIIMHWYEMLLAVKEIHAAGIIHSDLKPANFLFVGNVLKIIDFGIACSLQDDKTSVHKDTASGTLNYMSPEAAGQTSSSGGGNTYRITYKSDVWSLGCILYNMIYGRTPYSHIPNTWAKMLAIARHKDQIEFKPQLANNVTIPPTLLQSMKLCLQKDPKARPTVVELLAIIENRLSTF